MQGIQTTGKLGVVGFGGSVDDQDSRGDNSSTVPCELGAREVATCAYAGCVSLHRRLWAQTQTLVRPAVGRLSLH